MPLLIFFLTLPPSLPPSLQRAALHKKREAERDELFQSQRQLRLVSKQSKEGGREGGINGNSRDLVTRITTYPSLPPSLLLSLLHRRQRPSRLRCA